MLVSLRQVTQKYYFLHYLTQKVPNANSFALRWNIGFNYSLANGPVIPKNDQNKIDTKLISQSVIVMHDHESCHKMCYHIYFISII